MGLRIRPQRLHRGRVPDCAAALSSLTLRAVLVFLISVGWLAVVFLTLSICRAGARTDDAQDLALKQRIAAAAFEDDASVIRQARPALYPEARAYQEAG